jgi:hypothetical protein
MFLASFYLCLGRLMLGRYHYTAYIKSIFTGSLLGLGYSFYFTSQRVDSYLLRQQM